MHIPGFLVFLAIVVYWASCMGPRAVKWVGILFVSGCLVVGLGIAGLLVYTHLDDARRQAEQATQLGLTKAECERLDGRARPARTGPPTVDELIRAVDTGPLCERLMGTPSADAAHPSDALAQRVYVSPAPTSTPETAQNGKLVIERYVDANGRIYLRQASQEPAPDGKADYERLFGTPPARVAPLRSLTLQEHAILDTLKVEGLPRRLTSREKHEAMRLQRALVRGPLEAEDHKKLDALLQSITAKKQSS